ncbi:adaptin ear-binding coat-associated protein 1 [Lingula anatina]|uniref:Adaptin ear-binding coat-associated protein 1 n=1 Tax=Lingula anatina TaxID=7574 RepID=A0A1S3I7Z4_LINAN|nr:adaptin ear-binding coat-associated protein 1 [Lingula anatina]|eukprot:XP_013393981.1 adaptin ear-binding coat-associated protein 1 [Lingula anatina]
MAEYERVLCVKNEVFVYRIPPRPSNRGYRAADWTLDKPDWTGRLRVTSKGSELNIKLEDKISGELFAKCPVEAYPGVAVEAVMDSSRYFVLRIRDESGRSAFIGIGFTDRGDSFDLNVALQDHFKGIKQEQEAEAATKEMALDNTPKLDLGFKEGQTITLNIGKGKSKARPKPQGLQGGGGIGLLPPPPGGARIPPPNAAPSQNTNMSSMNFSNPAPQRAQQPSSNIDLLGDLVDPFQSQPQQKANQSSAQDLWGDFTSASSNNDPWEQF